MLWLISLMVGASASDAGTSERAPAENTRLMLARLATPLAASVKAPWVKKWAMTALELPAAERSVWVCTADRSRCVPEAKRATLPAGDVKQVVVDDDYVYGRIADPLGYARAYEVLAANGVGSLAGKKVLDFGYGNPGVLAMAARAGVDVTGIEIDALLATIAARLQGPVTARDGTKGRVRALDGYFPTDAKVVEQVGTGYDLFISKNTLKKGYIHPDRTPPNQPRMHIDLGVSDAEFLGRVLATLKPGGYFFIYNISPAESPADQPFLPWSDGRSPFTKAAYEQAGFEVLAFDVVDDAAVRAMAHVLEWDVGEEKVDLEKDLFAHYTLLRRPMKAGVK